MAIRVIIAIPKQEQVPQQQGTTITIIVYAGTIWKHCNLIEVERYTASSYEEAEEYLTEYLSSWLSPERAKLTASRLMNGETVLIGWMSRSLGIRVEPPANAKKCGLSLYRDPVYVQSDIPDKLYPDPPGTVFEPYYMSVVIEGDK